MLNYILIVIQLTLKTLFAHLAVICTFIKAIYLELIYLDKWYNNC